MSYRLVIMLSIIALSNNGFTLIRGFSERNTFNVIDLGLFLTLIVLSWLLFATKAKILNNPISILIIFYLAVVLIKVPSATLIHGQSLLDGFIAVRHQFYFCSFFIFLLLLKDVYIINKTLNILLLMAFILGVFSFIDYFYPDIIFVNKWENETERTGIKRGYVPGMRLMSFCLIWCSVKWVYNINKDKTSGLLLLFYFIIHFFRQTRSLILSCMGVLMYILFTKRKLSLLLSAVLFAVLMAVLAGMYMEKNIILNPFESATEEISGSSGTWGSRVVQAEYAWEVFKENPVFGSQGVVIRTQYDEARTEQERKLALISYNADLGYLSWLKYYGLLGVIWLIIFYKYIWTRSKKALRYFANGSQEERLSFFSLSYLYFVIFSFITIPHFLTPPGIVLLSLMAAITVRMDKTLMTDLIMRKKKEDVKSVSFTQE